MTKILCIDDTPEQELSSGQSLKEIIDSIFKDTPYKVIFKKTGDEGIKTASMDMGIKLVLLDVEFNNKIEGPEIADELQAKVPHVKVIVLTRIDDKGKKIEFGWKPNVVYYVLKREILMPIFQNKLRNLCQAIIEDYTNKNWVLEYSENLDSIILTNTKTKQLYGIDIPLTAKPAILKCMQFPNEPMDLPTEEFGKNLNKVHNSINENVLKGTDWNTWGVMTKEGCAKGQLKLVLGSVMPLPTSRVPKDPYVLQSHFYKFKKDIEEKLDSIEQALNIKSPQKNK